MPEERKRKVKVVVGSESSGNVDGSAAARDVGVTVIGLFHPDLPIVHEAVNGDKARRRVEDEGTEADDDLEIISVGAPLSIVVWCESQGITFEEAVGRAGLISETETALNTAGQPIC